MDEVLEIEEEDVERRRLISMIGIEGLPVDAEEWDRLFADDGRLLFSVVSSWSVSFVSEGR